MATSGALAPADLARAVALQQREDARFGEILLAQGMVTPDQLYQALAQQYHADLVDLRAEPPDVRLIDQLGVEFCIQHAVLPWQHTGGATVLICARPDEFETVRAFMPEDFGQVRLAIAPEIEIQAALIAARRRALSFRAETRVAEGESCRSWQSERNWRRGMIALAGVVVLFLLWPMVAFSLLAGWAAFALIATSGLKTMAVFTYHRSRKQDVAPAAPLLKPPDRPPRFLRLPTVTLLVPLFRESEIAGRLINRLSVLDYPRELLDICLIVEEDDAITQRALDRAELPLWMRRIVVPCGAVRTKPRAMNFALDFARGSIIGVYDAEDAPAPDQIHKVVRRFAERGPSVACLQGVLDFYNSHRNWLARAFTIEYATWFRIVLPGLERMGLAVPLGGTTLFFRRSALEELGGWDAHNVTEDADLGVRLARFGYRTELIDTITREEANCAPLPWIRQRSRWIKGYAMTWAVHMRQPRQLLHDLGLRKFIGVQLLFLGSFSQFLLAPLLWSFWSFALGLPHPFSVMLPGWAVWALFILFALTELMTIAVGIVAVWRPEHRFLVKWVPSLHLYWPLASIAALKASFEILTRPYYWDKTAHGHLHREADLHRVPGWSWKPRRNSAAKRQL
ncbi:MAG: glycosyltransferase [Maritimibacter sp.]